VDLIEISLEARVVVVAIGRSQQLFLVVGFIDNSFTKYAGEPYLRDSSLIIFGILQEMSRNGVVKGFFLVNAFDK
jgi:hypothetical protein